MKKDETPPLTAREQRWVEDKIKNLFKELTDNCQASLAETDISDGRRAYRKTLYAEALDALENWPKVFQLTTELETKKPAEPKGCSVELNCEGGIWECERGDLLERIASLEQENDFLQKDYAREESEHEKTKMILETTEEQYHAALKDGTDYRERIFELQQEIDVLRQYGNKDCTAMADEALAVLRGDL